MDKNDKRYFNSVTTKDPEVFKRYVRFLNGCGVTLKNQNICDLGCATGSFISEIQGNNHCFGVDHSDYAISYCRKHFGKLDHNFAVADLNTISELPFKNKFDLITMFDVIEHIDNLRNLKILIAKSLNRRGYLLITTPNANNFLRFLNRKWFTGEMDKTHVNLFTPYTLDYFLRISGYEKVCLFTPYHFYFKNNWLTKKLPYGGQIFALYRSTLKKV